MIEFTLTGIFLLFIVICLWWMCMAMWEYHTVAEAVNYTAREASVHGAGCAGQTCATTVATVAQMLATRAVGMPASQLNVTLTSSASTVTCNPLSSCSSNSATWPSLAGNTALTTEITIAATFQFSSALGLWSQGGVQHYRTITLGSTSTQPVFF
jgi:hypothetical protein